MCSSKAALVAFSFIDYSHQFRHPFVVLCHECALRRKTSRLIHCLVDISRYIVLNAEELITTSQLRIYQLSTTNERTHKYDGWMVVFRFTEEDKGPADVVIRVKRMPTPAYSIAMSRFWTLPWPSTNWAFDWAIHPRALTLFAILLVFHNAGKNECARCWLLPWP